MFIKIQALSLVIFLAASATAHAEDTPAAGTGDLETSRVDIETDPGEIESRPYQLRLNGGAFIQDNNQAAPTTYGVHLDLEGGAAVMIEGHDSADSCDEIGDETRREECRQGPHYSAGLALTPELDAEVDIDASGEEGESPVSRVDIEARALTLLRIHGYGERDGDAVRAAIVDFRLGELGYRHLESLPVDLHGNVLMIRPLRIRVHGATRFRGTRTQLDGWAGIEGGVDAGEMRFGDRPTNAAGGGALEGGVGLQIEDSVRIAAALEGEVYGDSTSQGAFRYRAGGSARLSLPEIDNSGARFVLSYRFVHEGTGGRPEESGAGHRSSSTHYVEAGVAY